MRVSAEEDVDLPAVCQGLGIGDLRVVGRGLVLLTELGVDDDEVGARRTGRRRRFRDGADVVECHRVAGGILQAVEVHGRGDLGDGHGAPTPLKLVEREGDRGVLSAPVGARVAHPVSVQGVQGGHDAGLPPVRSVVGGGRAAIPSGSRQGGHDLGRGAEGGVARVDPVRSDRYLHPAQGQIQALDPGGLSGDVGGDVPRGPRGGFHHRHVHEDVAGVTHGEVHVLRAADAGGGGRSRRLSRHSLIGTRRATVHGDGCGENDGGQQGRSS